MSILNGKQKYGVIGACAGVLVLAGGLCGFLLSGDQPAAQLAQSIPESTLTPPPSATAIPQANIVVGTPEVDLIEEQHRQEKEAIVIRNVMLPGTHIYGVDVSGMSRDEARAAVEEKLAREPLIVNLLLSDGTNLYPASGEGLENLLSAAATSAPEDEEDDDAVDPAMKAAEAAAEDPENEPAAPADAVDNGPVGIQLQVDVDKAVTVAFSLMRDQTVPYDTFMLQVQQIAAGVETAPAPDYNIDSVNRFIEYLSGYLDTPAVNSSITMEDNQIVYTQEAMGRGIDRDSLVTTILGTDPLSGETISIPIHDLEPSITREMLQSKFVLRGAYTTSFSDSTKNRKYNIRNAGAYEGGEVVQQPGGGVCQLSSTLYNAALYADMEIVERRNHSMPVHYVDRGRDATINSIGNIIDFKFRNNTSSDVIIMAYTTGNTLHMEIYGVPMEGEEYDRIEIRTKQTSSTSIKTEYTYLPDKPTSYKKTTVKGSKGYKVRTYKDYYLGDTLVKTDDLGLSVYNMFPKKVEVGMIEEDSSSSSEPAG